MSQQEDNIWWREVHYHVPARPDQAPLGQLIEMEIPMSPHRKIRGIIGAIALPFMSLAFAWEWALHPRVIIILVSCVFLAMCLAGLAWLGWKIGGIGYE